MSGVGNLLGPMLGSVLYSLGGYSCPFFGIALIHALIILLYMFIIKIDFEDNLSHNLTSSAALSFAEIMSVKRSLFGFLI